MYEWSNFVCILPQKQLRISNFQNFWGLGLNRFCLKSYISETVYYINMYMFPSNSVKLRNRSIKGKLIHFEYPNHIGMLWLFTNMCCKFELNRNRFWKQKRLPNRCFFSLGVIIFQKLLYENERVSQQWGSVRAWTVYMDLLKNFFIYLVR